MSAATTADLPEPSEYAAVATGFDRSDGRIRSGTGADEGFARRILGVERVQVAASPFDGCS